MINKMNDTKEMKLKGKWTLKDTHFPSATNLNVMATI